VKNIELYNFNFKENYVSTNDRHQLGFIAQEVQTVYPKAVDVSKITINARDANGEIENILTLNTTQIDYTLYGAVKNLIEKIDNLEDELTYIENNL
jgi:actin-like ATPase involved in cell morphogenesis